MKKVNSIVAAITMFTLLSLGTTLTNGGVIITDKTGVIITDKTGVIITDKDDGSTKGDCSKSDGKMFAGRLITSVVAYALTGVIITDSLTKPCFGNAKEGVIITD